MKEVLIKNKKEKKHIKDISDWVSNQFGFTFLELSTKKINSKGEEVAEREKIKVLKAFSQQKSKGEEDEKKARMFFYNKPALVPKKSKKRKNTIGLDIINVPSAIAEATVIQTAVSILEEEGYTDISIALNAIGDKESQLNFKIALTGYYREHRSQLKPFEKKKITIDPFGIYFNKSKKYLKEINELAPKAINFLSNESISHFQEVIEYIENANLDYKIDEDLIGSQLFFSKIIFKIFARGPKDKEVKEVGYGGRYDDIASVTVKNKEISAIGLVLDFKKQSKKIKLKEEKYSLHLLRIGSTAKVKSLEVLNILRKMQVPISYKIEQEKLSEQIQTAMEEKTEYALVIGELEAKSGKILVRNMKDASQIDVKIKDLSKYAKRFLK